MARRGGADPDLMAHCAPKVTGKLIRCSSAENYAPWREPARAVPSPSAATPQMIAVLTASGIRAGELAGIRYDPHDASRSDLDLQQREITVRGKGGRPRVVRIGHEAALALDRYLRIRSKHAQAWRPQLWLGVNNRGPMTANGIYQMIARRGRRVRGRRLATWRRHPQTLRAERNEVTASDVRDRRVGRGVPAVILGRASS